MGWKNVKEHYAIKHIVRVTEEGICIGSSYVHNILIIRPSLVIARSEGVGRGEPFNSYVAAMEGDKARLRELIESPDIFAANIPVYTFNYQGEIIQKLCDVPGWPNLTHDGELMYDNTHFLDRAEAVVKARRELEASAENRAEICARLRVDLEQAEKRRADAEAAIARLNAAEGPP